MAKSQQERDKASAEKDAARGALIEHGLAVNLGLPARPVDEFQGQTPSRPL